MVSASNPGEFTRTEADNPRKGHIVIQTEFNTDKWAYTGVVLVVEILHTGTVGSLYFVYPPTANDDNDRSKSFNKRAGFNAGQLARLEEFRKHLDFTLARVDENLALVENPEGGNVSSPDAIAATVLSRAPVEILQTASPADGQPGIPVPLEPISADAMED